MLIYVLRHGITQWNKLKKVQGAMDIPLAPEGIELAKRTGEALKDVPFDICFTSPLARARQTAHYVLGNRQIPVIEDKRIQEIDFGVLEGSRLRMNKGRSSAMKWKFSLKSHRNLNVLKTAKTFLIS
mgnify:CR=1 FL=1